MKKDHTKIQELEDGYNIKIRLFELMSILLNLSLTIYLTLNNESLNEGISFSLILITLFAWLSADFLSGLVHWFADTWGDLEWPILGNLFIRSFKEHHIDPASITRHDWIETNGANFFAGIFLLLLAFFFQSRLGLYFILLNIFIIFTNQVHKWAHQKSVPSLVRSLQKIGLILNPIQHAKHHKKPFDLYYCITSGKLNFVLTEIGFFKFLERVITRVTGIVPRKDGL